MNSELKKFGFVEIISRGINWLIIPAVALLISAENYAVIAFTYIVITSFTSLALFGQPRAVLRLYKAMKEKVIYISLLLIFAVAIVLTPFIYLVEKHFFISISILVLLNCYHAVFSSKMRITEDLFGFASLRLSLVLFRLILVIFTVILNSNIVFYLYAEILAVLCSFLTWRYGGSRLFSKATFTSLDFSKPLGIGTPMFLSTLSTVLISHFDKILLSGSVEMSNLASYLFMFSIASSIAFITSYYAIQFEPKIYESECDRNAFNFLKTFIQRCSFGYLCILPFLTLILFFTELVNVEYDFSYDNFLMLFFGHCLLNLSQGFGYLMTYYNKTSNLLYCVLVIALFSVCSNSILIPNYGVTAAASIMLLSGFMYFSMLSMLSYRYKKAK